MDFKNSDNSVTNIDLKSILLYYTITLYLTGRKIGPLVYTEATLQFLYTINLYYLQSSQRRFFNYPSSDFYVSFFSDVFQDYTLG